MRAAARICAVLPLIVAACAPKGETAVNDSAATAAPPVVDVAAVRQSIARGDSMWADAFKRGDAAGVAALYTDDAMVLMTSVPAMRGRAAIEAGNAKMMPGMGVKDVKISVDDVEVHGDVAIETGKYEFTLQPPGATAPTVDTGTYVAVWKRQADGSWKLYRDASSSDGVQKK